MLIFNKQISFLENDPVYPDWVDRQSWSLGEDRTWAPGFCLRVRISGPWSYQHQQNHCCISSLHWVDRQCTITEISVELLIRSVKNSKFSCQIDYFLKWFLCTFRFLPPEIGDLIQLREFSVANNYIRTLPYELGRLFQLQNFGILGNPLPNDILSLYHEPNGLKKLLEFMLDHLNGKTVIFFFVLK